MITCRTTQRFSKSRIDDIYTTLAVQIVLCSSKKYKSFSVNLMDKQMKTQDPNENSRLTFETHKVQLT